jgi:hypothetical protein
MGFDFGFKKKQGRKDRCGNNLEAADWLCSQIIALYLPLKLKRPVIFTIA